MTIIEQLKVKVKDYRNYIKTADSFNMSVLNGTATAETIADFLINIHYLVNHTPKHIKLACELTKDYPELNNFFKEKFVKEQGHYEWAMENLKKVNKRIDDETFDPQITSSMRNFVSNIETIIRRDPYLYFPYIFFAEYLTVIYGPEFNEALVHKCGFEPESMNVITNHAELDQEHVNDWAKVIESIVDEDKCRELFNQVIDKTISLHKDFYLSLVNEQVSKVSVSESVHYV